MAVLLTAACCILYLGYLKPKADREERHRQNLALLQQYYDDKVAGFAEENKTIG